MTEEQMERLAKYATDSYFANLNDNEKRVIYSSKSRYLKEYIKVFKVAEIKVLESQVSKFEEFGVGNSKSFR